MKHFRPPDVNAAERSGDPDRTLKSLDARVGGPQVIASAVCALLGKKRLRSLPLKLT